MRVYVRPSESDTMNYIVVYAWYPSPSQTRAIQDSLGIRIDPHHCVLPIVSPPIASEEKARQQLTALLDSWRRGSKENAFIQPEVCDLPTLSDQQAITLARNRGDWKEFAELEGETFEVHFRSKQHPRCVVVECSRSIGGIPPGVGFLIDKFSGQIFPRRYIDVVNNGELI